MISIQSDQNTSKVHISFK